MAEILTIERLVVMAGAVALLLVIGIVIWLMRRRRSLLRRLQQVSVDSLSNILVPNGDGGEIHVEHALLTHQGVVIIDIKDVAGNVFGSDSMQDWTVISDKRRFTFSNPQPALYDRLAAIRRLMPDVPVSGYVAFTPRAEFTKGRPSNVIRLDELLDALQAESKSTPAQAVDAYYSYWQKLRDEAVTAQVGHLLND